MEFLHYKAGDFRSEWRTGQEYVQADYLDPWWQIVVGYPGITEQEISDITRGELKEMRVISLGHLQSEHLHQHCRELDQKRPMNPSTYNMMVDRIYQQYPSSDLMARLIRAEDIIMIP